MPKIKRKQLPEAVFRHLLLPAKERNISAAQFFEFSTWLSADPTVPEGRWFKRFSQFTVCGEGELVKTFLLPGQAPDGEELF